MSKAFSFGCKLLPEGHRKVWGNPPQHVLLSLAPIYVPAFLSAHTCSPNCYPRDSLLNMPRAIISSSPQNLLFGHYHPSQVRKLFLGSMPQVLTYILLLLPPPVSHHFLFLLPLILCLVSFITCTWTCPNSSLASLLLCPAHVSHWPPSDSPTARLSDFECQSALKSVSLCQREF